MSTLRVVLSPGQLEAAKGAVRAALIAAEETEDAVLVRRYRAVLDRLDDAKMWNTTLERRRAKR